jgi:ankyrin repeat protein
VTTLLSAGAQSDCAMECAASNGHVDVTKALLSASISSREEWNAMQTAMEAAAIIGYVNVVTALLEVKRVSRLVVIRISRVLELNRFDHVRRTGKNTLRGWLWPTSSMPYPPCCHAVSQTHQLNSIIAHSKSSVSSVRGIHNPFS